MLTYPDCIRDFQEPLREIIVFVERSERQPPRALRIALEILVSY